MGNESDKLVFDYLSRIGDLAHSTPMTAAERARLVSGLRGEIDRMRAEAGGAESKAAVKKILTRLGRPEDVVAARGSSGSAGAGTSAGTAPAAGAAAGSGGGYGERGSGEDASGGSRISLRKGPKISLRKRSSEPPPPPPPTASYGASAPHLAGIDELGPEESDPDWWRVDPSPYGDGGGSRTFGGPVPGFVGGIELPELLKPPPGNEEGGPGLAGQVPAARKAPDDESGGGTGAAVGGRARRLWPGRARRAASGPRVGGVVELAAAAVLVAGAAVGSLIALGVGWLAAWWSPRLSRTEAKWAVAGMPGLVAAATLVWMWDGPLTKGGDHLTRALTEAGPVVLRVAAVASAVFLVWRARRPKP